MTRTRIKICGMMRVQDALAAAEAGADAIGLVFHPASPRNVNIERAHEIVSVLPAFVTPVAIFVDAAADTIHSTVAKLGIRHVQLNGHESPELISELREFTVTKAVRVESGAFARTLEHWRTSIATFGLTHLKGIVLETAGTKQPGGSGVENNWSEVLRAKSSGAFHGLPAVIAAGGLRPETVADVVKLLQPYAVDVSSGVEEKLGEKSETKIRDFIAAVQSVG